MMQFPVDVNEFERAGSNERYIIPDNTYTLEVLEVTDGGTSKNGDPKLDFKLGLAEYLNNPEWPYNRWTYHSIYLIPAGKKGHGIALHFLKVLGAVPDEKGVINIEPSAFVGRRFQAYVFSEKDQQGVLRQRMNHIEALPEDAQVEEVPF
ncbi:MAG: hypothetical protein ACI4Q7_02465 [Candidatus Avelusimicrobium sp.]